MKEKIKKQRSSILNKLLAAFFLIIFAISASIIWSLQKILVKILVQGHIPSAAINQVLSSFIIFSIFIALAAIILALAAAYFIFRRIIQPIIQLRDSVKKFGDNNLELIVDIKTDDEAGELAVAFQNLFINLKETRDKLKQESRYLEKEVAKKTKDLQAVLEKAKRGKKEIENQRAATLNILEDVSESQAELKKANDELGRKEQDLIKIKELSDQLSNVLDAEKAVSIFNSFVVEALDFNTATYLVINPEEEGGLVFATYANKAVSEKYIEETRKELLKFLKKYKKNNYDPTLKIIKNLKARLFGIGLDNSAAALPGENIFFPVSYAKREMGVIQITSEKKEIIKEEKRNLIEAMIAAFSVAIDRLHTLTTSQHSKTVSLIESLSDGVLMYNIELKIVLINPAFEKYTGLAGKNLNLEKCYEMVKDKNLKSPIYKSLTDNELFHLKEAEINRRIYEVFITPVNDSRRKTVGGAIILHDITEIKEIDRMKTEFVSVASHQLRTPLTAIKLFIDMLVRGDMGKLNKEQAEYLDNIYQSSERMARLVNDLLNVTRIESGRLRIDAQPVEIKKFINSIIAEAKPLAASKGGEITFTKDNEKWPKIPLDQNLIRQVIHNLIVNAIRYAPEGKGKIEIILAKDKQKFTIAVKDNGMGIPKKAQNKIFKKFFRADNAVKAVTEGTGLGLYVSKMIVEASGGKISFVSEENKGTTFLIELPLKGMKSKEGERGLAIS